MFIKEESARLIEYLKRHHELYLSIFKGRHDVVAKRWEMNLPGGKKKPGYSPICNNRFKKELCLKYLDKDVICDNCEHKNYSGITSGLLDKHFDGKLHLGCYPLQKDTMTWFVAADFDNHDPENNPRTPLADVQSLVAVARKYGVPTYALSSRSGNGFHAYLFFEEAVSAGLARGVMLGMLAEAGIDVQKKSDGSYDRLFPSQDKHSGAGYGNLIGMPFQGEVLPKGCTVFVDPDSGQAFAVDEQINMLNSVQRIGTDALKQLPQAPDEVMTKADQVQDAERLPTQSKRKGRVKLPPTIAEGGRNPTLFPVVCSWIKQGMEEASILAAAKSENQLKCVPPLDDSEVERLVKYACARYANQSHPDTTALTSIPVRTMMDDAPCHEDVVIPANFELSKTSGVVVYEADRNGNMIAKQLCFTPVLILKRLKNTATQHEDVLITWWRDNNWHTQDVGREVLASSNKILTLSSFGIPITSVTAPKFISYLTAFEAENQTTIPIIKVTNSLGWQLGMTAFLAGNLLITQDGYFNANVGNACNQTNAQSDLPVVFKGKDVGDAQLAEAFSQNGTYEGWISAINEIYDYPYVFGNILAAFSTPLLAILAAQNFVIDTAFTTSKGKTTTLRGAASVWGNPSGIDSTLLHTWNNTDVWIGRAAATLNDLPLILDDTKLAADGYKGDAGKKVSGTLYKIASGRDRGRGSLDGTRITDTWRTVLLSTGEQSAVDFTDGDGGTRARVISIWGAPFGDENNAEIVKRFTDGVTKNYGHAGPRFIKFLLDHKNDWDTWRDAYDELKLHYADQAGQDSVANRMSAHFATLAMTATLVHAALPELKPTQPIREIINAIFEATKTSFEEADRSKSALKFVYEFAVSNQNKFWSDSNSSDDGKPYEPHGGWAGRWDQNWSTIDFAPAYLNNLLNKAGYDAPAILKAWRSHDWLKGEGKSHQRSTRLNGKKVKVYSIKRTILQELDLAD